MIKYIIIINFKFINLRLMKVINFNNNKKLIIKFKFNLVKFVINTTEFM